MSDSDRSKAKRGLALLERLEPSAWAREARQYYRDNGTYRAEDFARSIGKPRGAAVSRSAAVLDLLQRRAASATLAGGAPQTLAELERARADARQGLRETVEDLRGDAKRSGASHLSDEDIASEIAASRAERRTKH